MRTTPLRSPDPLRDRLWAVGLRAAGARIAVLRVLSEAKKPLSHADVLAKLTTDGFDRVTVYRNLVELAEVGIATRIDLGDRTWRFEIKEGTSNEPTSKHPHFVCVDCGEISRLSGVCVSLDDSNLADAPVPSRITEILLKGHCGICS